jgi:hypothetical protein
MKRVRRSRTLGKFSEVRRSFFHKSIPTLLPFFGHVIKKRGVSSEFLESGLSIAIGIERGLEAANGQRGFTMCCF